jgi:hypothetical protein
VYLPGSSGRARAERTALSDAARAIASASTARASCDERAAQPEPVASFVRAVIENEPNVLRCAARTPAPFARTISPAEVLRNPAASSPARRAPEIAVCAAAARVSLDISASARSNASGTAAYVCGARSGIRSGSSGATLAIAIARATRARVACGSSWLVFALAWRLPNAISTERSSSSTSPHDSISFAPKRTLAERPVRTATDASAPGAARFTSSRTRAAVASSSLRSITTPLLSSCPGRSPRGSARPGTRGSSR